jgi:uncharacterized protein YvpB
MLILLVFVLPARIRSSAANLDYRLNLVSSASLLPTLAPSPTRPLPTPATRFSHTPTVVQEIRPAKNSVRQPVPLPASAPLPKPVLPSNAEIKGMFGYGQLMALSCEARSAADWARHFGIDVREYEFFTRLPKSDNPEKGFVGSVNGGWGNTPPDSYGVHAQPVAALLREYGAKAHAVKNMTIEGLKSELASGRPVMVWVTGHVVPGEGIPYEVDGQVITVAPYEHTVIVVAYNDKTKRMTFLDGKEVYWRSYETFRDSWAALENLAIIWHE